MKTACLVLASGLSNRFGETDKLLTELKGQALLAYCLDAAKSVNFDGYFVVTPRIDARAKLATSLGFSVIDNSAPEIGIGNSIALGARYLQEKGFARVCILLGDMPFVTPEFLQILLARAKTGKVAFSQFEGRDQPPAIFAGEALTMLASLTNDRGASSLDFSAYDIIRVDLPEAMTQDFDIPADFETP